MEARLSEIFEMVEDEIAKWVLKSFLGGYVLTGGVVKTPGILDLAQHVFQNRVRGAEPNYIGVESRNIQLLLGLLHMLAKSKVSRTSIRSAHGCCC